MIASCGPALRNSLANIIIRNISAKTISAAIIYTWFSITSISPLRPVLGPLLHVTREFFPRANVSESLLVAGDYDLGALGDGGARFGTRAGYAARATLYVNQFSDSGGADRHAHPARHPDHVVIGRVQRFLVP